MYKCADNRHGKILAAKAELGHCDRIKNYGSAENFNSVHVLFICSTIYNLYILNVESAV